jgi:hypothetical protein
LIDLDFDEADSLSSLKAVGTLDFIKSWIFGKDDAQTEKVKED